MSWQQSDRHTQPPFLPVRLVASPSRDVGAGDRGDALWWSGLLAQCALDYIRCIRTDLRMSAGLVGLIRVSLLGKKVNRKDETAVMMMMMMMMIERVYQPADRR